MKVVNREARSKSFSGFLVGVCAIVGGTLTVAAAVDLLGDDDLGALSGVVRMSATDGFSAFIAAPAFARLRNGNPRLRIETVAATLDGFELAEADLELRREGDVLGDSQSGGRSSLRLLRVVQDSWLILEARVLAERLLETDPVLATHDRLRAALERRVQERDREFLGKS